LLVGQTAPDFTLESMDGAKIRLVDAVRNKVALVTFWGVACGPCRQETPHLSALYEKSGKLRAAYSSSWSGRVMEP